MCINVNSHLWSHSRKLLNCFLMKYEKVRKTNLRRSYQIIQCKKADATKWLVFVFSLNYDRPLVITDFVNLSHLVTQSRPLSIQLNARTVRAGFWTLLSYLWSSSGHQYFVMSIERCSHIVFKEIERTSFRAICRWTSKIVGRIHTYERNTLFKTVAITPDM